MNCRGDTNIQTMAASVSSFVLGWTKSSFSFFVFLFLNIFIGVYLLYNGVLVSAL